MVVVPAAPIVVSEDSNDGATFPAVSPAAVPVRFVAVPEDGVPKAPPLSTFVATAVAILSNSVLISVPLMALDGSP